MARQDLEIAFYLKRLFDAQMARADPEKDNPGRLREAVARMDARLGPEWRARMESAEIQVIPVKTFMERVNELADEEGIPRLTEAVPGSDEKK